MDKISLNVTGNHTVKEVFDEFIDYGIIKNLSAETLKWYEMQYSIFQQYLKNDELDISEITYQTVTDYILFLRKKGTCNEITVNSYLKGIRTFLYFAMEKDYLEPFTIKIPKANKKIKETYTDDELKVLLKKPNMKESTFNEYKMWVFINYLLATGNRISTALDVKIGDVDFKSGMIQLNNTKYLIAQIVPLSVTLSNILKEYLRYRNGNNEDYLFCNSYGKQGDIRTYQEMLKRYNNSRGVMKTSAHLFRHTFAKKWILNGGDVFRLQKILGHSDLTVVKEYVNMFGSDMVVDFNKYNPLDVLGVNTVKPKIKMVV